MKTTTSSPTSHLGSPASLEAGGDDAVEIALEAARETILPKTRTVWPWVLISQALVLIAGTISMPLFTTHLILDKGAIEAQEAEVRERAKAYVAAEEAQRANFEIQEEHRESLKKQERTRRRNEVVAHVGELAEIARRVREKRDEQLTRLTEIPPESAPDSVKTELDAALETLVKGAEAISASDDIEEAEPYDQAVKDLQAKADDLKRKANEPAGLDSQDRTTMSERLDGTRAALETLKETNRDPPTGDIRSELDDAQAMVNLLRSTTTQMGQLERQRRSSDDQLRRVRQNYLNQIKGELDRIKRSHQSLLSHGEKSPAVKKLSDALDTMGQTTQDLRTEAHWDQAELERDLDDLMAASDGVKEHIRDIHNLGDQGQTRGLVGTLHNQQRQADSRRRQWDQLCGRHAQEAKRTDQAVNNAIAKVESQWQKTRDILDAAKRPEHEKAITGLLDAAREHAKSQPITSAPPLSAEAFRAKATKVTDAVKQTAAGDQLAEKHAEGVDKELDNLAGDIAKDAKTAHKHVGERDSHLIRLQKDWQGAEKQLNDTAARAAAAFKPASPERPAVGVGDPKLAKVKTGLERLAAQTQRIQAEGGLKPESVAQELAQRGKALAAAMQDARRLNQRQVQMQRGISRDEAQRLERNLNNLARSLGRKASDVARNEAHYQRVVGRRQLVLQQSLDRLAEAEATTADLGSADANAVGETLASVSRTASELAADPSAWQGFQERVAQAQQQAAEWYRKASGMAKPRQLLLADAWQQLRRVSEAMAASRFSRLNGDAAADLLSETWPEIPNENLSSLEDAVAAAEALHDRIETDFHSLRAAEITARSGQSFEQMRHEAGAHSDQSETIEVPDADMDIPTVGALRAYRQAIDTAVARTERLTQQARTMQRQALGLGDPRLAKALQEARAAASRQQARGKASVRSGRDPGVRRDPGAYSDTRHQMTFDGRPAREKELEIERIKAEALPGRRFTEKSKRRGWLYVDTWYVIGPWENHGRIDYSNVRAPEFEIDLAKAYPGGKAGRELRWQFTQHPTIRCDVPDEQTNSTYYAYTEVYFDQPREMLVAIATNDAGKLWIDDQLIWQDDGLSIWNMDEGFRRVRFKQGFSRVLIRVENGPRFCQYSLMLCPPDI